MTTPSTTLTWSEFKTLIDSQVRFREIETVMSYRLFATDGFILFTSIVDKNDGEASLTDYVDNYRALANKGVIDSEGVPLFRQRAFANADNHRFRGKGVTGTAIKTTTTDVEYTLTEDRMLNGVKLILKNHAYGDKVDFQVVDKDYLFAGVLYPADYNGTAWSVVAPTGVVLDTFASAWAVEEGAQDAILLDYPARIQAGMTIRMKYTSVGTELDVNVTANLFLHMKTT